MLKYQAITVFILITSALGGASFNASAKAKHNKNHVIKQVKEINNPLMRQPAISPNGKFIIFVSGGNLYSVASKGGTAQLILDDPSFASDPVISPDGKSVAFKSGRSGGGDIYLLQLGSKNLTRLTFHDALDTPESWSKDGNHVIFSSSRGDIFGYPDIYSISRQGGTPVRISGARFEGEYNASVSPDGQQIAFNSNDRVRQWYRMGPKMDDATEIWVKSIDPSDHNFHKFTTYEGKDSWPMWARDGRGLYFVTDENAKNGAENIAYQSLSGERRYITNFQKGRVSWPSIANDNTIVFERDFQIWKTTARGKTNPLQIKFNREQSAPLERISEVKNQVAEFRFQKDGLSIGIIIFGDLFIYNTVTKELKRVTETPGPEQNPQMSPDGAKVAYLALREGFYDLFIYDIQTGIERRLTNTPETESSITFSPDGSRIGFVEDNRRLLILNLTNGQIEEVAKGVLRESILAWQPNGKHIAFTAQDVNSLRNVWVTKTIGGSRPTQLTDFPNIYKSNLTWSDDGRQLLVGTYHQREIRQAALLELPKWILDEDEPPAQSEFPETSLIIPGNEGLILVQANHDLTKVLLRGRSLDKNGIWLADIEGGRMTNFRFIQSRASQPQFLSDGSIAYLRRGKIYHLQPDQGDAEEISVSAEFDFDPVEHQQAVFREAWMVFRDLYADHTFNGLDWEQSYEHYLPFAAAAKNRDEFNTVFRLMIGDLNASHINLYRDQSVNYNSVGMLGVEFDPGLLGEGVYKVIELIEPLHQDNQTLKVGDVIKEIDDIVLDQKSNINAILEDKVGKGVPLKIERNDTMVEIEANTYSSRTVSNARYEAWVDFNSNLVNRLSKGRFKYIHRTNFGWGATEEIRHQLGASGLEYEGIVLDIRYNGGGVESTRTIGFLQRSIKHLAATRDLITQAPSTLTHGIGIIDRPVVLVQNEQALSDSENFSHQFRSLGIGPVVGTRTSAFVKGSNGFNLFDGSRISIGAWMALSAEGEDFDRIGRQPDTFVDRSLQETLEGRDSQLSEAVKALDKWIKK